MNFHDSTTKLNPVILDPKDLTFGSAPFPVKTGHEVTIGGGEVYPEINFTLPPVLIDNNSWQGILSEYREIISEICQRAVQLDVPALVVEFEHLPPMTLNPEWGAEITRLLADTLNDYYDKHKLRSALRVTPVDIRDIDRPPKMRPGELVDKMLMSFELCASSGADMLAIESTGGKEIHDEALIQADIPGIIFSLGVLGVRDMRFLWNNIVRISCDNNVVASGDTACGFANTAMILADKGLIPKTLSAVVRAASIARSLQAYLMGAKGPSKDCAYEGPFMKAFMGVPISMEGKSSACAHLSNLGNIAGACCDLWSNESVQNVRLLSTYAPVVSLEQLTYDCRLMNEALKEGHESVQKLQKWMTESDACFDPQAYMLQPEAVVRICSKMSLETSFLKMTITAVNETLSMLREASQNKTLRLIPQEQKWLDLISFQMDSVPQDEEMLYNAVCGNSYVEKLNPHEYLLNI